MSSLHQTILSLYEKRGFETALRLQREQGGYRAVTAAAARESALRLSAYLHAQGVRAGDRVMLVSENGPEWVIAALAVLNLRAVLVPVAAIGSALEIENTFRGAGPRFCIYSRTIAAARALGELARAEGVPALAWNLQEDAPLAATTEGLAPHPVDTTAGEADPALLLFTSGTTGNPKGVPITHGNVLANARGVLSVIQVSAADRLVSVLPLSHMLEFTGGFVLPALKGVPVTYTKGLKPDDLLRALRDTKATVLIAVPLLFEVIARNLQGKLDALPAPFRALFDKFTEATRARPGLGKVFFFPIHRALGGHVRFFVAGGSRLHPQTFEFFRGLGITLLQGYGLTETSPVLTLTSPANAAPDHVGPALPGLELGIFGEDGARRAAGEEGEIWARGPSVFGGYLDPAQTADVFANGWFKTGDLGTLDAAGLLRITGRKKDIIVTSAGKNVYPEEIEGLVLASHLFLEAAALGMKDSSGHEKVTLVLVPDRARFPGLAPPELKKAAEKAATEITRSLAEYKWPQRIEVLFTELPKTSTRKVKKHELRKILETQGAAAAGPGGATLNLADPLEAALARGIAEITKLDPARVALQASLTKDLGLDSLTFVELVGQVEQKFRLRIEGMDFAAILTVADLVGALQFAAKSRPRRSLFNHVFFTDFRPRANRRLYWRIPRRIFHALLRRRLEARYEFRTEGLENLADGGPFVFAPNHSSHFDLLSISGALPAKLAQKTFAVAAKDYFFNRTWKALGARVFVNAIPFDRKGRVNESMEKCREALGEGSSLVIFPEGTRSPTGALQDFKPGVGQLLAGHPRARAVPVFIDGAYQIMPKGSKRPGAGRLRVRFGKPISFRDLPATAEAYREISDRLRAEVVDLSRGRLH